MGRFGLSIQDAGRTTYAEFDLLSLAHRVQDEETKRNMALQAWLNQQAKAEKNVGTKKKPEIEPYYKTFNEFYDQEKEFYSIFGEQQTEEVKKKPLTMADRNRMLTQRKRKEETDGE